MLNLTLGASRASIATSPSYFCRAHGSSRVAAFALATVLGACHSNDAAGQAPTDANSSIDNAAAVSTLERELNPQVSAEDKTTLASDNAAFAFDLYRKLKETDGNLAFSPASISLALAMTYAGAAATTASEMARTLHFTLPPERLHRAFNDLDQTLASRGQGMTNTQEGAMRLNIANSVWLEQTLRVLPSFLDVMAVSYGAGVNLVSFLNDAGTARVAINAWVANHTAGKIAELLAPGEVDGYTRMVLANAVYFNAAWLTPFNALNNHANSFTLLDGTITTKKFLRTAVSPAMQRPHRC